MTKIALAKRIKTAVEQGDAHPVVLYKGNGRSPGGVEGLRVAAHKHPDDGDCHVLVLPRRAAVDLMAGDTEKQLSAGEEGPRFIPHCERCGWSTNLPYYDNDDADAAAAQHLCPPPNPELLQ